MFSPAACQTYNPENMQNVPEIVEKYQDKQETLFRKLRKKYGLPDEKIASTQGASCSSNTVLKEEKQVTPAEGLCLALPDMADIFTVDHSLDFRSADFDALKALSTPGVKPPVMPHRI
jgi:hypothetical protein